MNSRPGKGREEMVKWKVHRVQHPVPHIIQPAPRCESSSLFQCHSSVTSSQT